MKFYHTTISSKRIEYSRVKLFLHAQSSSWDHTKFLDLGINSLLQAFDRLEVAEFSAKSLEMGTSLGNFASMNDNEIDELRKAFF